jgi:hypothetical protein
MTSRAVNALSVTLAATASNHGASSKPVDFFSTGLSARQQRADRAQLFEHGREQRRVTRRR